MTELTALTFSYYKEALTFSYYKEALTFSYYKLLLLMHIFPPSSEKTFRFFTFSCIYNPIYSIFFPEALESSPPDRKGNMAIKIVPPLKGFI